MEDIRKLMHTKFPAIPTQEIRETTQIERGVNMAPAPPVTQFHPAMQRIMDQEVSGPTAKSMAEGRIFRDRLKLMAEEVERSANTFARSQFMNEMASYTEKVMNRKIGLDEAFQKAKESALRLAEEASARKQQYQGPAVAMVGPYSYGNGNYSPMQWHPPISR